jgi:membrane protease YdiL (CAAX protease family)
MINNLAGLEGRASEGHSYGTLRNLVIFTVVVLASGWIGRWVDVAMGSPSTNSLGMLLWLVFPSLSALLLRAFAGDGWADLGFKPKFRGNGVWYAVALLVYPVLTALALGIGGGLRLVTFPGLSVATLGVIAQTFALGIVPQFIKNIFEEAAWRGYLTPKLYSLGFHGYLGHILTGVIWGAWHIPYYLFFLDRTLLQSFTALPVAAFIPVSIVVMVVWALVYGEIRLLTGSIWPVVLMHMVEDAFVNQLILEKHIAIAPGSELLVSPVNGIISGLLFVAVGVALNRYRHTRQATRLV